MDGETHTLTFDYHKSDEYFDRYLKIKSKELNEMEKADLHRFLNSRSKGEEGQVVLYGFKDTNLIEFEKRFEIKKYRKIYSLFPNVPWDAALMFANTAFKDLFEWISITIQAFKERPNDLLLIKIHPSEISVMESRKTVLDFIKEMHDTIPPNVKLIPPDTKISPYSILDITDTGLVYNGTIGMEMAIRKIPVIVAGNAHYSNKGFTYDIKSKEQYTELLKTNLTPKDVNMAEKYAYFYFIKTYIPNSFINATNLVNIGWNIKSFKEFEPGKDKYLDHICNYIIDGGVFQDWDKK
jgi:hypothetical protein